MLDKIALTLLVIVYTLVGLSALWCISLLFREKSDRDGIVTSSN